MKNLIAFLIFFGSLLLSLQAKSQSCGSCCPPVGSINVLSLAFLVPTSILFAVALLVWYIVFRSKYMNKKQQKFDSCYRFFGEIPKEGTFNYKWYDAQEFDWRNHEDCRVTFSDSSLIKIEGVNYNYFPSIIEGTIQEKRFFRMDFKDNERPSTLKCYLSSLPFSAQPGLFIEYQARSNGSLILLPQNSSQDITALFPNFNSNALRSYFVLIFLFCFLCVVTFSISQSNLYYSYDFADFVITYPWGAFVSFFGLIIFFIFANPFGLKLLQIKSVRSIVLFMLFYIGLLGTCLGFSAVDLSSANFMNTETLIDTRVNYDISDHQAEIKEICQLSKYDCTVLFYGNYTYRTSSCPDQYGVQCYSFNYMENSCSIAQNNLLSIFLIQGLSEFMLFVFWTLALFITVELGTVDRWTGIKMKLEKWNRKEEKKEIEMSSKKKCLIEDASLQAHK